MITRSQTSNSHHERCALKDVSNHIDQGQPNHGHGPVNADNIGLQKARYNLRPRKTAAKSNEEKANIRQRRKKGKKQKRGNTSSADVDEVDSDPQFVAAYVNDIYEHLRAKEKSITLRPHYMKDQTYIDEHMRQMLVNFLVEVHMVFNLVPETLYLTVNIVDRYLSREEVVSCRQLQLLGITALRIASKFEEVWEVALEDCVYICDKAFSRQEITGMEEDILRALEYRFSIASAHSFLVRFLKAGHCNTLEINLSYHILDSTLPSYYLLNFLPSQLAAAAVFIARKTAGKDPWSPTLLKYAQYREEDVLPVARAVVAIKTYCSAGLFAVNQKYAQCKYGCVSNMALCSDF